MRPVLSSRQGVRDCTESHPRDAGKPGLDWPACRGAIVSVVSVLVIASLASLPAANAQTVTLTLSATSLAESNSGVTEVTVTATLSAAQAAATSVTLSLAGTATNGSDYTVQETLPSVTIQAGQTTGQAPLLVTPTDDNFWESDESIEVNGTATGGLTVNGASLSLTDDESQPSIRLATLLDHTPILREEATEPTTVRLHALLTDSTATLESDTRITLEPSSVEVYAHRNVDFTIPDSALSITLPAGQASAYTDLVFTPIDDSENDDEYVNLGGSADTHLGTPFTIITEHDTSVVRVLLISDEERHPDLPRIFLSVTPRFVRESELPDDRQVEMEYEISTNASDPFEEPVSGRLEQSSSSVHQRAWGRVECPADFAGFPDFTLPSGVLEPTVQGSGTVTIGNLPGVDCYFRVTPRVPSDSPARVSFGDGFNLVSEASPRVLGIEMSTVGSPTGTDDNSGRHIINVGQTLSFSIRFTGSFVAPTEAASAKVSFRLGDELRMADCSRDINLTQARNSLFCRYEVAAGDIDLDGISIAADALFLESTLDPFDMDLARAVDSTIPEGFRDVPFRQRTNQMERHFRGRLVVVHPARNSVQLRSDRQSLQEGAGPTNIVISATYLGESLPEEALSIPISFANLTATAADYTVSGTQTIVIPVGSLRGSTTLTVTPLDDGITEASTETVRIQAVPSDEVFALATELQLIDAATIRLSASEGSITEDGGAQTVTVTAELGDQSDSTRNRPIAVALWLSGTAGSGDYAVTERLVVTIPANARSGTATLTFTPVNDRLLEGSETIVLRGTTQGLLVHGKPLIDLLDDEMDPEVIISVSDAAILESEGVTQVEVSARLDPDVVLPDRDTVVTLSLAGTATLGTDYLAGWEPANAQITIPQGTRDGAATVTLALTPQQDALAEGDETIEVEAVSVPDFVVQVARVTLEDDDQPGLVLDPARQDITEGQEVTYEVSLAFEPTEPVTVSMTTDLSGTDLSISQTLLAFTTENWQEPQTLTLTAAEDDDGVADEPIKLVHEASGGPYDDVMETVTVTIRENDAPSVTVTPTELPVIEGMSAMYTVMLNSEPTDDVTVMMTTALAGTDLSVSPSPPTLTFTPDNWDAPQTVTVTAAVDADALTDAAVELVHAVAGGDYVRVEASSVTVQVADTTVPELRVGDGTASEGAGSLAFTVTLSQLSSQSVTVEYTTAGGTATEGTDYTAASGTLTFAAGDMTKTVSVTLTDDSTDEADEEFELRLSSPMNATLAAGMGTATGTITDDDDPPTLSVGDKSAAEDAGTLAFTVTLSAQSGQQVTVAYATAGGTATEGTDYTAASGTLTFAAGETTKTVAVTLADDSTDEADEEFELRLSSPMNATLAAGMGTATGTITDDDATPTLSAGDKSAAEDAGTLAFTVTLSAASGQEVTVAYSTAGGTATEGTDYTAASGTLTFAAGETTKTVSVALADDSLDEPDEAFELRLSSPMNATLARGTATGTITDDDATPTLSVGDKSSAEGTGTLAFTVTLSAQSGQQVTVAYSTAGGTATEGTDYTAASGTLTFAAGETTKTVAVTLTDDSLDEADEAFELRLSAPVNATLARGTATGTITDDDDPPTLSAGDKSAAEDAGTLAFTVTLSAQSGQQVTVAYATAGGTATEGTDYTAASGTLTFAAGETTKTVTVTLADDSLDEADEVFELRLSAPVNATLARGTATGTITDDDDAPTLSAGDKSAAEDAGTLAFTVTLSAQSGQQVTVAYATASGTATEGTDYTAASGTLTFAAGETTKTVAVTLADDSLDEPDEAFELRLSAPEKATLARGTATGTITDDDDAPTLSVSDKSASEGTGTLAFTVTLSAQSGQQVTVAYATAGGTATEGTDYTAASGTLTFAAGETTKTVAVTLADDSLDEPDEAFELRLSSPMNATLARGTATGTITDDDDTPTLSVSDKSASEGTGTLAFTVTLSAQSGQQVTVAYATASGTATEGTDYTAASGTLTFAAGETTKTVAVTLADDTLDEPDEAFELRLSAPGNATLARGTATGTITDDDDPPTLSAGDKSAAEDAGTLAFTVTLSAQSGQQVTVAYATAGGTATEGTDYTAASGTLTFAAGETTKTVTVTLADDSLDEADEVFELRLSAPVNATLARGTATGTITDDDDAPTLSAGDKSAAEDAGTLAFTVTLSAQSGQQVTVAYATASGTATEGTDYTAASGTLTFAAGETTKTVAVTLADDSLDEPDEAFELRLSAPEKATLARGTATGTITDDDDAPTLSVSDKSASEGTGTLAFTVTLSAQSGQQVTVAYATAGGTATEGTDYTAASGTLTFAAGETTKTVAVTLADDSLDEPDEAFELRLSAPEKATLARGTATGTINDDDDTPTLSVSDKSASEGTGTLAFTVTLSAQSGQQVTVAYATASGTATEGTDYTAASGTLTFAAGETTKTVAVTLADDTLDEPDEAFELRLSAPGNATLARGTATGTINDNDGEPSLSVGDQSAAEGAGTLAFTVTLSPASGQEVTVGYATAGGTATEGTDYTAASGTLTFAAGETTKTVTVTLADDTLDEPDEAFELRLSAPGNATLSRGTATGTITDNDDTPSLSAVDKSAAEGAGTLAFTVTLSAQSGQEVTVGYATAGGTATEGTDYTAASGTLTFAAGETTKTVSVTLADDALDEPDEAFELRLSAPGNATLARGTATGTITDDDDAPTLSVGDKSAAEGAGTLAFTVTLSPASGQEVTVEYATAGGTATEGTDYTAASGTLTFAAGETSKTVSVTLADDTLDEPAEAFELRLSAPQNATLAAGMGTATGTINDNDGAPSLSVADQSASEGAGTLAFTVTLSPASGQEVTVGYATAGARRRKGRTTRRPAGR